MDAHKRTSGSYDSFLADKQAHLNTNIRPGALERANSPNT